MWAGGDFLQGRHAAELPLVGSLSETELWRGGADLLPPDFITDL